MGKDVTAFSMDAEKAVTGATAMLLVGVDMPIDNVKFAVSTQLNMVKAIKWRKHLRQCQLQNCMGSAVASKFAGRLQFTVCAAMNKIGRCWIRAFYMQVSDPMNGSRSSALMKASANFWGQYMVERPLSVRRAGQAPRRHIRIWADAA
jgi:hypothetical protein